MKNDLEHKAEVAVPHNSRRKFIRAAVTTGGAAILSAELAVLTARGSDDTAAQIVLPAGFEYSVADIGSASSHTTGGPMQVEIDSKYGQFANLHLSTHGVVRA